MSMNLFLALAAEHKQRTRHDIFTEPPLSTRHLHCDVCLHLGSEWRHIQKAEREHYEEMAVAAPPSEP